MNVLIVSTNRSALPMPVLPFGACVVAEAAQRAGHEVAFLDLMFEKARLAAIATALARTKPDVVGLSLRNIDNNSQDGPVFFLQDLKDQVSAIRRATKAPIVLGGAALTVMPEEILRFAGVAHGVLGDGEVVFPMVLDRLAAGKSLRELPCVATIENGAYRQNPCITSQAASICPAPDYRRWLDLPRYQAHMATIPVQTKLGCQFQCVYCTYRKIEGGVYRLSDPKRVADVVAQYATRGLKDIEFVDSVFNAPHDHAMAVCEALAKTKHGARLQTLELNPYSLDDALLAAMERAGFASMGVTVESASDRVLERMRKGFTAADVRRAAEAVSRRRLPCAWIFLFGGPGETAETAQETLRFAETAIGPRDVAFFNAGIRIYPGTELETIARRQGVLTVPPREMLDPAFYLSPEVNADWLRQAIGEATRRHKNFVSAHTINLSFLPAMLRVARWMGMRPPLWRYTRRLRRALQIFGISTG